MVGVNVNAVESNYEVSRSHDKGFHARVLRRSGEGGCSVGTLVSVRCRICFLARPVLERWVGRQQGPTRPMSGHLGLQCVGTSLCRFPVVAVRILRSTQSRLFAASRPFLGAVISGRYVVGGRRAPWCKGRPRPWSSEGGIFTTTTIIPH